MCFSADASLGAAVVLLPVGGYCAAAALYKHRAYLPLAITPILFGVQQLGEAVVWLGLERGDIHLARAGSGWFLLFALAVWPAWAPLAAAAIEPPGGRRWAFRALTVVGLGLGSVYYLPLAAGDALADPVVVGHSLRYDFSAIPAVRLAPGWVWPAVYLVTVCAPLLASRDPRLRPLGALVAVAAAVAYVAFREAFASVWCFLTAALSVYLAYALYRLPDPRPGNPRTPGAQPAL
jgi:hypothetical protein